MERLIGDPDVLLVHAHVFALLGASNSCLCSNDSHGQIILTFLLFLESLIALPHAGNPYVSVSDLKILIRDPDVLR